MNAMDEFDLTDEDEAAIGIAMRTARRFLKQPQITPYEIIGLGNALYALNRLPLITPGALSEFGIAYRAGTKEFREMRYITFSISEYTFGISKGGSVYEARVGSDSFSDPGWFIDAGGYRNAECELYDIEDSITEYLNLGGEISISDDSEIEYE
jgi:hypothetical protein